MSNEGDFRTVPATQGLLKTFKAMQSQKSRKYFIKRQESWNACKIHWFFFGSKLEIPIFQTFLTKFKK